MPVRKKAAHRIYALPMLLLVFALFVSAFSACTGGSPGAASGAVSTPEPTPEPSPTPTPIIPEAPGIMDDMASAAPTVPPPTEAPAYGKLGESEAVDDSFFDDAAFLGNSLVDGFRLYSGLTGCTVYASTSMTVVGAGDLVNQMPQGTYGKVYILLGINEIGYDSYYFKELYSQLLDQIVQSQPDADIYIMGLSPVSANKSASSSTFNMDKVNEYNDRLLELAEEKRFYYIDLCEALAGEDGFLPAECTTDGVHFTPDKYTQWLDYLKTHHGEDR